ncbi:MAG: hypothetical protein KJZ86_18700 [Caldilineaceae bacterium]|nr:hypothetical protein [Caldilineaceae bacterium]HRJ44266.1 hypothetical protein [Caldilineaceae bacterium]
MAENETITIVAVETIQPKSTTRGGLPEMALRQTVDKAVSVEALSASFNNFINGLRKVLNVEEASVGDLVLDEIEFSVEIGANGEFKLLGAGISANAGSSLTFTLRRKT